MAQWLDTVRFGNGKNGSPAVSGTINTYATCTGTATQSSLTTTLSASEGDVILIHQTQGTGAGQWELNYVITDAGSTLTLAYPLAYTYGTGAQCVLVPQYTGGTLSGSVTSQDWDGSTGGIVALMSNGDLTISGSITSSGGYRGGSSHSPNISGTTGENSTGGLDTTQTAALGQAGGGGNVSVDNQRKGGGGGGYGTSGSNGGVQGSGGAGIGGGTAGSANNTTIFFGGGGGSGSGEVGTSGGTAGGKGGGAILIIAKNLTVSGSLNVNGTNGVSNTDCGAGGGGAGGAVLIKTQVGTLGSSLITANAGAGGDGNYTSDGGAGGVGRIHIDYYTSYTGTTTPTIDASQDTNLKSVIYTSMI